MSRDLKEMRVWAIRYLEEDHSCRENTCAKVLGWDCVGEKIVELKGEQGVFWKDVVGHCEGIGLFQD